MFVGNERGAECRASLPFDPLTHPISSSLLRLAFYFCGPSSLPSSSVIYSSPAARLAAFFLAASTASSASFWLSIQRKVVGG